MSQRNDVESKIIKKAWEDPAFKNALIADPKATIEKMLEVSIPADMKINVVEESVNNVYLVIPANPVDVTEPTTIDEKGGVEPQSAY